jgi:hypothetical protein
VDFFPLQKGEQHGGEINSMTTCASCDGAIEQREGAGRPSIYCSEGCRRQAEFRIRALVRRIDSHESDIRWARAADLGSFHYFSDEDRKRYIAMRRRWLAEDEDTLRKLLGVHPSKKR